MEIDVTKEFREHSRGKYYNDFSFMNKGSLFPNLEMFDRCSMYRVRYSQLIGEDSKRVNLVYQIAGEEHEIPIQPIGENFFKLLTNKILDLIFNNEWTYQTGNIVNDKKLAKLIERTGVKDNIRLGIGNSITYGDVGFKVYKNGISNILPIHCFKVVDANDYCNVLGNVIYSIIDKGKSGNNYSSPLIKFEVHTAGWVFDIVFICEYAYPFVKIGNSVSYDYKYGNSIRNIPVGGKWYRTGVDDCSLLNIASVNKNCDGAYGQSLYVDIQDNVYALQQRLTIENSTLNNLTQPLLIVGSSMTEIDPETGGYRLKITDGKYLVYNDMQSSSPPSAFQQDYKLDNSEHMVSRFLDLIYLTSEMGKPFMCGDYGGGNLSTESIENLIKPAIDKSNRILTEVYYVVRDSIYCLARLNGIVFNREDLNISFNIGRTDNDEKVASIIRKLIPTKQFVSIRYVLEKYLGLDSDQVDAMMEEIRREDQHLVDSGVIKDEMLDNNVEKNGIKIKSTVEDQHYEN